MTGPPSAVSPEIAVLITGSRWNGPRFFGLRSKTEESSEPANAGRSKGSKQKTEAARSSRLGRGSDYRNRKRQHCRQVDLRTVGVMGANTIKPVRCAIYTRKSTEHWPGTGV